MMTQPNARAGGESQAADPRLRRLAALAVNQLCGGTVFDRPLTGEQLREAAIKAGLFDFDEHHHAPACPANHWHQMRLPTGACTCGAARLRPLPAPPEVTPAPDGWNTLENRR